VLRAADAAAAWSSSAGGARRPAGPGDLAKRRQPEEWADVTFPTLLQGKPSAARTLSNRIDQPGQADTWATRSVQLGASPISTATARGRRRLAALVPLERASLAARNHGTVLGYGPALREMGFWSGPSAHHHACSLGWPLTAFKSDRVPSTWSAQRLLIRRDYTLFQGVVRVTLRFNSCAVCTIKFPPSYYCPIKSCPIKNQHTTRIYTWTLREYIQKRQILLRYLRANMLKIKNLINSKLYI
jgi:hypothetical protein